MLPYQPTGFQIDGADLTQFFMEAHSNHNVTGTHDMSPPENIAVCFLTTATVSRHVLHRAGIRLSPGTYHVIPKVGDGYHLHLPCTLTRTAAFEVDFSGVFFYFTVRPLLPDTWRLLMALLFHMTAPHDCLVLRLSDSPMLGPLAVRACIAMKGKYVVTRGAKQRQMLIPNANTPLGVLYCASTSPGMIGVLPTPEAWLAMRSAVWPSALCRITGLGVRGWSAAAMWTSMGLTSRPGQQRSWTSHRGQSSQWTTRALRTWQQSRQDSFMAGHKAIVASQWKSDVTCYELKASSAVQHPASCHIGAWGWPGLMAVVSMLIVTVDCGATNCTSDTMDSLYTSLKAVGLHWMHGLVRRCHPTMRSATQVDDGYPSDRILLRERISVITFLSDTLLVKNQPCPDLATPDGLDHRQKLAHNIYQFAYLPGCAGAPRDLFVVRPPRQHGNNLFT